MSISEQEEQRGLQAAQSLPIALDFIKELCDILNDPHTRNHQETIGNAYMNAMAFYQDHRPPQVASVVRYEDGTPVDDLPF